MTKLHPYAARVLADLSGQFPWESEFLQAVEEVLASVSPVLEATPQYEAEHILERLVTPERAIAFRVVWTDDQNRIRVNHGYRVQFNSALGPYKGGIRFHASVSQGSLKFLGFEQIFKNALTGLPLGGGKGGADLDFRGRSDGEMMRFCQAYMSELFRHIGPETDVPAGDIGVGGREIGYLFGQYRRLTNSFNGSLTGKGLDWGGSKLRPEATGYGIAYFAQEALRAKGESLDGKTVAVSGFGNVAWGTVRKMSELGARVVTLSGPDGFIHDPAGICGEKAEYMQAMRWGPRDQVQQYAEHFGVKFTPDCRPWVIPCDVAIPCAIQNELDESDAAALLKNGCRYLIEGANMPSTPGAMRLFREAGILFVPGKAANAGGVAVSGLEMAQNGAHETWGEDRVDATLRCVIQRIHDNCRASAEEHGMTGDYVAGANIGGFKRVADAMLDQGAV